MILKCISLWQPWASAMALGLKHNETRGWRTHYRGLLGIHAAKKDTAELVKAWNEIVRVPSIRDAVRKSGTFYDTLPRCCIVAVGTLYKVVPVEAERDAISLAERALGDYSDGRFALKFTNVRALANPIPARGAQGFFNVEIPDGIA